MFRLFILMSVLICFSLGCDQVDLSGQVINLFIEQDETLEEDDPISVRITVNQSVDLSQLEEAVESIPDQGVDIEVVSGDNSIIPGASINGLNIGDSLERVKELFGEPKWLSDFDSDSDNPWWFSAAFYNLRWWEDHVQISYLDIGLFVWLDNQTSLVKYIGIYAPSNSTTPEGNGLGSSLSDVKSEFGEPVSVGKNVHDRTWHDYDNGIAFLYDDRFEVNKIIIH